jgi:hypothetical protein
MSSSLQGPHSCSQGNPRGLEVHPAFHGQLTQRLAALRLNGFPPMTYILWTGVAANPMFISFVNSSSTIEHRLFMKISNTWHFQNGDPHITSSLRALVVEILHCRSDECKMLMPQLNLA